MAYVTKKFTQTEPKKIFKILMDELDISIHEAQKTVDRKRVFLDKELLVEKNLEITGEIEVVVFEPNPIGLKPIYENEDFAIFDKPSGVLIHPRKREDVQTLNDDIKYLYGTGANAAHRIDKETSGLVLVSKNKNNEADLKALFENKLVQKEYVALVVGKIENAFEINEKLLVNKPDSKIRIKVHVDEAGKEALTKIEPLAYYEDKNMSLIKAIPLTGRQHQIRTHLFHVEHSIVGDPIYGVDEDIVSDFLDAKLNEQMRVKVSGAKRLLLHANRIVFEYKGDTYDISSEVDIENEFIKEVQ